MRDTRANFIPKLRYNSPSATPYTLVFLQPTIFSKLGKSFRRIRLRDRVLILEHVDDFGNVRANCITKLRCNVSSARPSSRFPQLTVFSELGKSLSRGRLRDRVLILEHLDD
jgi:hypothetical protein